MGLAAVRDRPGLGAADFRLTCESGFGDGWNAYAHSMAWFEGRLYVGTTRAPMAAIKVHSPAPDMKPWPVDCPPVPDMVDRRAEIFAATFANQPIARDGDAEDDIAPIVTFLLSDACRYMTGQTVMADGGAIMFH